MTIELLARPLYGFSQVDDLLRLPAGTARRWINGYERRGHRYLPVVREQSTGSELVTWGEFVETKLLAAYRDKGVAMLRMRPAVERLREVLKTPYPLAGTRLNVVNRELVARVQDEVGLAEPLRLVVVRSGQLVWATAVEQFIEEVEWGSTGDEDLGVTRVRPFGSSSPVVIDPTVSFGEPSVRSIRTSVVAEEFRAGETFESVAESFGLSILEVSAAIRFEMRRAA